MLTRLLVASFLLFLLIPGIQPRQAEAWCCGCSCMYGCTCSGYYDRDQKTFCWYCRSNESAQQTKAFNDGSKDPNQSVNETLQSSMRSDMVNRVTEVRMLRPCLRNKIALSLLGDSGEALKFEPVRFDENKVGLQTLALQVEIK